MLIKKTNQQTKKHKQTKTKLSSPGHAESFGCETENEPSFSFAPGFANLNDSKGK